MSLPSLVFSLACGVVGLRRRRRRRRRRSRSGDESSSLAIWTSLFAGVSVFLCVLFLSVDVSGIPFFIFVCLFGASVGYFWWPGLGEVDRRVLYS